MTGAAIIEKEQSPSLTCLQALTDVFGLQCPVQHYAWGDRRFIPALIGDPNPKGKPCAELWMGAHPDSPSDAVLSGGSVSLIELIKQDPERILHPAVATRFDGQLPFLFKILAAAAPLSLQVHPDRENAAAGFARENAAGVPVDSPRRNYRDPNHKPELVVASTDFYGLRGFRELREIGNLLDAAPELRELASDFRPDPDSLRRLYTRFMTPHQRVDQLLGDFVRRLEYEHRRWPFSKTDWEYWLLRANCEYSHVGRYDRGLFAFLFLNLVHLKPGEGMFLPAGVLHAYLAGAAVEIMASSNNVLRGGLTPKHIDVPELLRNVTFTGAEAEIIRPQRVGKSSEWTYATSAREFELRRIELEARRAHGCPGNHAVEILIVLSGGAPVRVRTATHREQFDRGQVFLITAGTPYELYSDRPATLYKATVPLTEPAPAAVPVDMTASDFRGRQPTALSFGTSGLRGLVADITDLEAFINTSGFLAYLSETGQARPGETICLASDLRPSSDSPERSVARAVAIAIEHAGFQVEPLGHLPTPALTYYAMRRRCPSIMVTGSHIPFDRNGIKFNKRDGEVLKDDEPGILRAVQRIRAREYARPTTESLFADNGMFKPGVGNRELKPQSRARREYTLRYLDFFSAGCLRGLRIVVYQHSSVARDLLTELLISLGAQVIPKRRSEEFVPVDTEAMSADKLDVLKQLVDEARRTHGLVDAIVSTDGDGDRPLMAAVARDGRVQFLAGDLLGIVVADFLGADVAVVPVSANDAVDQWAAKRGTMVIKTKIGSPHVIAAMQRARSSGHGCVVGWEANGGFLTATDITRNCRTLTALPTRDATLPILAALCSAKEHHCPLVEHFGQFSCRFGQSGLVDHFPPQTSRALLRRFTPGDTGIEQTEFEGEEVRVRLADGTTGRAEDALMISLALIRQDLEQFFRPEDGFDRVTRVNTLDGIRVGFANGDIAHIRPSGNAPQLRIYAVADSQARADAIVAAALREPDGILRRLEAAVTPAVREPGFGDAIRMNITLTADLLARGETPEVIGTVSGSRSAQAFWQALLDGARESFRAREAISFQEDLPTNQALGLLLLWQRLEPHLTGAQGALVAFVFGEGTRSTPFTETDNGQKPAMATYVPAAAGRGARFLSMVELALRYFVPVQQFLRRSGFEGLVVKWGDEVQIPTCDLSGRDARFQDADIVRFVSVRELTADEAQNKDWVGVNAEGRVTAFIPRRPLELMGKLADRGLLQQRNGKLYGGINLGSIAVSRALLDGLLAEFSAEVNDSRADRAQRPALDPEFFTALTVAAIEDPATRAAAWEIAKTETAAVAALERHFPDLLRRLRRVIQRLEKRERRKFQMVALDFGRQFWGDIGQHTKMYEFFMALAQAGEAGEVARAIAGLPAAFDAQGNLIVNSTVSPRIRVRNSVLINVELSGRGTIERSVLVGTRAGNVEICDGFEILSRVTELRIEPRGGTYKVISDSPVHAGRGERLTTLFLTATGPRLFRVHEDTNLRDQAATYDVPILGNPLSFQQAHAAMTKLGLNWVENSRGEAEATVLKAIRRMD